MLSRHAPEDQVTREGHPRQNADSDRDGWQHGLTFPHQPISEYRPAGSLVVSRHRRHQQRFANILRTASRGRQGMSRVCGIRSHLVLESRRVYIAAQLANERIATLHRLAETGEPPLDELPFAGRSLPSTVREFVHSHREMSVRVHEVEPMCAVCPTEFPVRQWQVDWQARAF